MSGVRVGFRVRVMMMFSVVVQVVHRFTYDNNKKSNTNHDLEVISDDNDNNCMLMIFV